MTLPSIRSVGWWQNTRPAPSIDLGDGRVVGAEDVLESHYRRLSRGPQPPRTRQVAVQVEDNLTAAITVLAPDLAPLTRLAEEVAAAMPSVQPAPQFRSDLQRALERTHRQHAAQRALGTRQPPQQGLNRWRWPAASWLAVLILLLLTAYLLGGRRQSQDGFADSA